MVAATDAKAEWVARVLGFQAATPIASASAATGGGMAVWQAARITALASLKALEGSFRAMKQPQTDPAIILLRAIQANLTAEPSKPTQVRELIAYLGTDRIIQEAEIANGFGFKVELRRPLLTALAALKHEQEAAGKAQP